VATLQPEPQNAQLAAATPFTCLLCGDLGGVDVLLNVLLFLPYGAGLRLAGLARRQAILLIVLTTGSVELTQYLFLAGRDASLSDLLTNTVGGAIGIGLAEHWRALLLPDPSRARRLAVLAAALWLGVQAVSAWALTPSLPPTAYWGQRVPSLGQFDRFGGTLGQAWLVGEPMPSHRLPHSAAVRDALLAGRPALAATIETGPPTARLAPIASVFDEFQHEIVLLGQRGSDLVFRERLHAADLRLRTPAVRLPAALPPGPGVALRVFGTRAGGRYQLSVEGSGQRRAWQVAASPSWGWSLLVPFGRYAIGPEVHLASAGWLALLLVPLGYWTARSAARGPPEHGAAAALVAAALVAVTVSAGVALTGRLAGLAAPHWSEWLGAAVGVTSGWSLGRYSSRWPRARRASSP
jgi:hypothetical protein